MITRADALEVLAVVVACHHRTAPKMDDPDATKATAQIWAELFNEYNLALPDLIAAVKRRAGQFPDAPEAADIVKFARDIRRQRDAEAGPSPAYEALCESKGTDADELAEIRARRTQAAVTEDRPRLSELTAGFGKALRDA